MRAQVSNTAESHTDLLPQGHLEPTPTMSLCEDGHVCPRKQRFAACGHCTARGLQAHTAWPEGVGATIHPMRLIGDACHLCIRPSLHSSCTTQYTF